MPVKPWPARPPQRNGLPTLDDIIAVPHHSGIFADVLRFGLNTLLTPDRHQELVKSMTRVRRKFQEKYGAKLSDYVEFFDENAYLSYSDIAENLTFGTANHEEFSAVHLSRNDYFMTFLRDEDLLRLLISIGVQLARQTVDILGNLPPDNVFSSKPMRPKNCRPTGWCSSSCGVARPRSWRRRLSSAAGPRAAPPRNSQDGGDSADLQSCARKTSPVPREHLPRPAGCLRSTATIVHFLPDHPEQHFLGKTKSASSGPEVITRTSSSF
jgi:hypothetical protein